MIRPNILTAADRLELLSCVKGQRENHGVARRANAAAKKAVTIEKGAAEVNGAGRLTLHPITRREQAINDDPEDYDHGDTHARADPGIGVGPAGDGEPDPVDDIEDRVGAREGLRRGRQLIDRKEHAGQKNEGHEDESLDGFQIVPFSCPKTRDLAEQRDHQRS